MNLATQDASANAAAENVVLTERAAKRVAKILDDIARQGEGATVLIDPVSLEYMKGCRIDFVDDLIGQSFKIENPNATASCGCGTSFSI